MKPHLTISSNNVSVQKTVINPLTIQDKFAGWWKDGVSQINGIPDLQESAGNYTMPNATISLENATKYITLNQWYIADTPQSVSISTIANFCGSRQLYNATDKELIIIGKDQYLSAPEEDGLIEYLNLNSVAHQYHQKTDDILLKLPNTTDDKERSRLDNFVRLLDADGIDTTADHLWLTCFKDTNDMLVDLIGNSNITKTQFDTAEVSYLGLAPQEGSYTTGASPDLDNNISLNDAYYIFKYALNFDIPYRNYYFSAGTINTTMRVRPYLVTNEKAYSIQLFNSSPYFMKIGPNNGYHNTTVVGRLNNDLSVSIAGQEVGTFTAAPTSIPTEPVKIGGEIATAGNSNTNYQHALGWGGGATLTQRNLLSEYTDVFCEDQKAKADEYITTTHYRFKLLEYDIKATDGENCITADLDNIYFSTDLGKTRDAQIAFNFTNEGSIDFCEILDDGTVLIGTSNNKFYRTTTALVSLEDITPPDIHIPSNPLYPGEYFKHLGSVRKYYLPDDRQIVVWGNYCNVQNGASPVIVWYYLDGQLRKAFVAGENPWVTDNSTFIPGPGGTLLGDALQTIRVRHTHAVNQSQIDKNIFYACFGDFDRDARDGFTAFLECLWISIDFTDSNNPVVSLEMSGPDTSRVKSNSIETTATTILYGSDGNPVQGNNDEKGIFETTEANLTNLASHTRIFLQTNTDRPLNMFRRDSEMLLGGGHAAGGQNTGDFGGPDIYFSFDLQTFFEELLPMPGNTYFYRIREISNRRYLLNAMPEYSYKSSVSAILDFNIAA